MVDFWSLSQLELCTFLPIVFWIKKMVFAFEHFICHPCCNASTTIVYYLHLLLLKIKHLFKFTPFCYSKTQVQQFHLLISSTLGGPLFVLMFWLALVGVDLYLAFLEIYVYPCKVNLLFHPSLSLIMYKWVHQLIPMLIEFYLLHSLLVFVEDFISHITFSS